MAQRGHVLRRRGVAENDRCRVTRDEGHDRENDRADDQEAPGFLAVAGERYSVRQIGIP